MGSSDGGAGVTEAQKRLEPYQEAPTKITLTEPLKSKPPSGKSVVMLGTNDPNNQKLQKGLQELAELAGWSYSTVAYDPANPATLNGAINTALSKNPDYVAEAGIPLTQPMIDKVKRPARSGC